MQRLAEVRRASKQTMIRDLQSIVYSYCADHRVTMAMKIVDKYEFQEGDAKTIDGVDIIPARHTVLHEAYTLKKLSLKQDNKGKYCNLVNELLVLKEVSGEWVIKCHKMLKTSNNLYLVYDKMGEHTLAAFLENKKHALPYQIMESITNQLIAILRELKQNGIVNLNITPQTIEIIIPKLPTRNQKVIVRLNNFEYAILMRQALDKKLFTDLPVSEFKPPELDLVPPVVGYHSDIYSVGKILQHLHFTNYLKQEKKSTSDERIEHINEAISKMIIKDYKHRITLEELNLLFELKAEPTPAQKSIQRSKTLTTTTQLKSKDKQQEQNDSDQLPKHHLKRKMTHTMTTQEPQAPTIRQSKESVNFKPYCLQVLKRRNLSIFLLKCCQCCSQSDLADIDTIVMTSFLLLKKSTQVIASLSKFLMTGHDAQIKIPEKQLNAFYKTHDYFKLQSQTSRELNLSKKHLNIMVNKIESNYKKLMEIEAFANETSQEKTNEEYFQHIIFIFLRESIKNHRIARQQKKILIYFLLMSYIVDFGSFEKMFDELINQDIIEFEGQTLIKKLQQLTCMEMVEKLNAMCLVLEQKQK